MKALPFLFFVLVTGSLFAQPSQIKIPDYVLVGKTANELRFMRNEIFAHYGLIFKATELNEYFSQKKWYHPQFENADSFLTDLDKLNIELIKKEESDLRSAKYELLYTNESKVSIRKYQDPEYEDTYITKSTTVNYYKTYQMGMIKTISEATDFGADGIPTVIYAETIDPKVAYWSTTKYCHEIVFFPYYYQTIEYACCASENYHEFYNYNSEVPFLKANEKFFLIDVPNAGIDLFIGYNQNICNPEDLTVAELTLSTIDGVINTVKFKAKNFSDYSEIDAFLSPEIELVSDYPNNKVELGNRLTVWSKNFEKDLNKISDFSVRLTYTGYESGRTAIYEIPIVKGCLNGDLDEQHITMELKK